MDKSALQGHLWEPRSALVLGSDMGALLGMMLDMEASDARIKTGAPIVVDVHGESRRVTAKAISHAESLDILCFLFGSESAGAAVASGHPLDFAYTLPGDRGAGRRFRVNASSCARGSGSGIELAIRAIGSEIPSVESLRVEPEILEALRPGCKLVAVSGPTGAGKTTLLAGLAGRMLSHSKSPIAMATIESPIEFLIDDSEYWPSTVSQREVGRHVQSFAAGATEALRQNLDVVVVGETRDVMAAQACMDLALTGHLTMTSTHATGVPETFQRLIGLYPEDRRSTASSELVECLSLVVSQKLVPALGGGRVALREFLRFDARMVDDLLSQPSHKITQRVRELMVSRGRTFLGSARALAEAGLVAKSVVAHEAEK